MGITGDKWGIRCSQGKLVIVTVRNENWSKREGWSSVGYLAQFIGSLDEDGIILEIRMEKADIEITEKTIKNGLYIFGLFASYYRMEINIGKIEKLIFSLSENIEKEQLEKAWSIIKTVVEENRLSSFAEFKTYKPK